MPEPLISVVIPAYNRRDSVLQLLADVYRQQRVEFEVIVVDDCSPDDTVAAIREHFPQTIVLRNEKNSGPAVSRNRGIKAAVGEYIVGLDSDVTIPDRTFFHSTVAEFSANSSITGLAFRLRNASGNDEDYPRWWHPKRISEHASRCFETDYFSGTAYAFRRKPLIAAGLFPEWLYMHYEEVVLALAILDHGGTILHIPQLHVLHHASPKASRSIIQTFYKPRNQILWSFHTLPLLEALKYVLPRTAYNLLQSIRRGHFNTFLRALYSALTNLRTVLRHRRPISWTTIRRVNHLHSDNSIPTRQSCDN